jgi:hypothetical protein
MAGHTEAVAHTSKPQGSRWRIPARARPFIRLAVVAVFVMVADAVTGQLSKGGSTFPFPAVTAMRLLSALTVLRYPLAGFVFALEVDKWDWFWLGMADRSEADQDFYQYWDKVVDTVCLGVAAVVVLQWPDRRARLLALSAFAWRSIGVVAAVLVGERWLLIAFPNVFESIFLMYLIFRVVSGHQQMLYSKRGTMLLLLAVLIPKVAVEVFLHALNDRPWHVVSILPGALSVVDAWLWGLALYALPLVALILFVRYTRGRATHGDPETEVSAL